MRPKGFLVVVVALGAVVLTGCRRVAPMRMDSSTPVSVAISPNGGSAQRLTAVFQDPKGGAHIREVTVSVMSGGLRPGDQRQWSAKQCLMRYDVQAQDINLVPNMGGVWGTHPAKVGSSSVVKNSQCTVMAAGASSQVAGKSLTVSLVVEFAPEFSGEKRIYLQSEDAEGVWSANYQQMFGSLTVASR
ncbi:hypothetical protein [Tunturibacter empetritectus]|uniref:Uncharacterized protein n=1 Tax=Tunturiibacter empetritectus TaxID=3069691 RepID=A0A7W8MU18_9BACT|nr:hypothetical protein [Edaphobacter lichenicola]MBB5318809.1 hypothetical protein [Edaphobacter lichenicola]